MEIRKELESFAYAPAKLDVHGMTDRRLVLAMLGKLRSLSESTGYRDGADWLGPFAHDATTIAKELLRRSY
jgi:hypothetical protein